MTLPRLCGRAPLLALALCVPLLGGCITVARTPNGEWIAAIPVSGEIAESNWTKAGNTAAGLAPLADLVLPGAGIALTGVLGALGYGVHRGRRTTEEKYELAEKWHEDGLRMPQVQVVNAPPGGE